METTSPLYDVSMNFLCLRCREETERFFSREENDPRYCFELFRRAISVSDEIAWDCLYHRYYRLVTGWVLRHPLYPSLNEDSDVLVNRAFEKMWSVLSAEKFSHFAELKPILKYLQMCVYSVMVDLARSQEKAIQLEAARNEDVLETPLAESQLMPGPEDQLVTNAYAAELWEMLKKRIKNQKEAAVLQGMLVQGLKPSEVFTQYPGVFEDVREVYVVKDNLLARLRRDGDLKLFYEVHG